MELKESFDEALLMASRLHRGQMRKGTAVPYLAHLLGVAAIALEYGANEETAIAALLHDAVEDQGGETTLREIEGKFGKEVGRIVLDCTDSSFPKPPWKERKLRHLALVAEAPFSSQLVVAADKLHNARSLVADYRVLGERLWSRFKASGDETLWYYHGMISVLRKAPRPLVEELERTVIQLEALRLDT
ncbi:MAG TPA: phosphohydrolase [Cyanobacteria bacterium UBA8530]|nr:phosphohydrolase [Cyanobacteria bacterium UBA8530]